MMRIGALVALTLCVLSDPSFAAISSFDDSEECAIAMPTKMAECKTYEAEQLKKWTDRLTSFFMTHDDATGAYARDQTLRICSIAALRPEVRLFNEYINACMARHGV
jgi:hypothetical protein